MPKGPERVSHQIRQAVRGSDMSRYAICKAIGLSQSTMSRFMGGKGGLSLEMLDRLGEVLNLQVISGAKAGKTKRG